jgi:endonuclease/exonuclease/phosphatase family metal-dependent hydrolase
MRLALLTFIALVAGACGGARLPPEAIAVRDATACHQSIDGNGQPAAPAVWSTADEHRERLDAWCAAVGPAVVIDTPADTSAPVAAASVAYVTWNTHVGGGDIRAFVRALRAGDLTGGTPVEHVVLLLQEVFRSGTAVPAHPRDVEAAADRISEAPASGQRLDIVATARDLGLALFYVPSMRNGGGVDDGAPEDRGNAILSSLPLTDLTAIELPFDRQRRVAVAATVTAVDDDGVPWRLRVASAHLNATAGPTRLWLFASGVREHQARRLAAALAGEEPAIMGSDLNTWAEGAREPAVLALQRVFTDTTVAAAEPTFRFGLKLDYLFFRLPDGWIGGAARVGNRFGSDHHPLVGRLRID